jgi:hypothetical protein
MSKHTPGPWNLEFAHMDHKNGYEITVMSSDGKTHLLTWVGESFSPKSEYDKRLEADARLISCAPELLAALELLLAEHREFCAGGALPAEDVAREAIRKAKGEL